MKPLHLRDIRYSMLTHRWLGTPDESKPEMNLNIQIFYDSDHGHLCRFAYHFTTSILCSPCKPIIGLILLRKARDEPEYSRFLDSDHGCLCHFCLSLHNAPSSTLYTLIIIYFNSLPLENAAVVATGYYETHSINFNMVYALTLWH